MTNIRTSKEVAGPKLESMPIFHLFEFEGGSEHAIVALKKVRFGVGGMQVASGFRIDRPKWLVDGVNITAHLNLGSVVTVEIRDDLHIICGFPDLKKSTDTNVLPASASQKKNYSITSDTHEHEEVVLSLPGKK